MREHHLPAGDFPSVDRFHEILSAFPLQVRVCVCASCINGTGRRPHHAGRISSEAGQAPAQARASPDCRCGGRGRNPGGPRRGLPAHVPFATRPCRHSLTCAGLPQALVVHDQAGAARCLGGQGVNRRSRGVGRPVLLNSSTTHTDACCFLRSVLCSLLLPGGLGALSGHPRAGQGLWQPVREPVRVCLRAEPLAAPLCGLSTWQAWP